MATQRPRTAEEWQLIATNTYEAAQEFERDHQAALEFTAIVTTALYAKAAAAANIATAIRAKRK